jgi:hypothetical protein
MKNILAKIESRFLVSYGLLIIAHHILPGIIGQLTLLLSLGLFFRSRHNYFWLALFTLIFSSAAGFFSSSVKSPYIGPIPFFVVFYITLTAKYLFSLRKHHIFYAGPFVLLLLMMIFFRLFSGFDLNGFLKSNMAFLMVGVLPFFLKKYSEIFMFFKLIFIGVFIVFAGQLFHITSGINVAGYLFGVTNDPLGRIVVDPEGFIRPIEGITVSLLGLFGSVFLHSINRGRVYYQFIMIISFLAIWLTATRGWMLASAIIVVPFLFRIRNKRLVNIALVAIVFFLLITQVRIIENQFSKALERIQTLEYTLEGDLTAGGTVSRTTSRHEPVWNKFLESPIIGWGYSPEVRDIGDPHVGNQNLLLQVGVFGYLLFIALILSLIINMLTLGNRYKALGFTTTILIFFILGIFMIHSTSRQMFGLGGDFSSQFSIALVFTLANFVYYNKYEILTRIKYQNDSDMIIKSNSIL